MAKPQHTAFQILTYERRRQEIIDASLTVFEDQGCFRFRVEDVASQAGVAKGSVYTHFESWTEILQAACRQTESRIIEEYDIRLRALTAEVPFTARLALVAEILLKRDNRDATSSLALLRRLPCALESTGCVTELRVLKDLIDPLMQTCFCQLSPARSSNRWPIVAAATPTRCRGWWRISSFAEQGLQLKEPARLRV